MQSLVPQLSANTSRLLVFNAPVQAFISRNIYSVIPKLKSSNNFSKNLLKNPVISKKISTSKHTNVIGNNLLKPMRFKRRMSNEPSTPKTSDDVKIEVISSKKEEQPISVSNALVTPNEVGSYLSLLSIGAGLGCVALLKIPILTYLSMSACSLTLGAISTRIHASQWFQSLKETNPMVSTLGQATTFTSALAIGTNLLPFVHFPLRKLTLTVQASAVAGTLVYGALSHLPQIMKENPNFISQVLSHPKTTWSAITSWLSPTLSSFGNTGSSLFSKIMARRGEGFMFSKFSHAASWLQNGFVKSADELPQVAKQALETLNKHSNEVFTPTGIFEVEKISYRKRRSRTLAIGSFQRMERREGTSYIGKIYAKSSQRSVVINFEAQRPNLLQDPLPRHAHITSHYVTDSTCVFTYRHRHWFTGEYRVQADESVPFQFTHLWVESLTPEEEKATIEKFSKIERTTVSRKLFRMKFVNQNLLR